MTYKAVKYWAIQISTKEVVRYTKELLLKEWFPENLVFIDKVSFDNRKMIRKRGFGTKGTSVFYRSEYKRMPRISLLCMLGINGLLDIYKTDGTFNRKKVADNLKDFALNNKRVTAWPGPHSLWIMDGATIHCDPWLIIMLRDLGIIVLFLPAYCPFFNPIEFIFGYVKSLMKRYHKEGCSKEEYNKEVFECMDHYIDYNCNEIFAKCGYTASGFDPATAFSIDPEEIGFH